MVAQTSEWCTAKEYQEAHPELGSPNFVYDLARRGELPSMKISGRVLIRADALEQLAAEQARERSESAEVA